MAARVPFRTSSGIQHPQTASWRRRIAAACLCAALAAGAWSQTTLSEYDVKAAYLLDFGKFIRIAGGVQPQRNSFDICILGRDPIGHVMDEIAANESIDKRPVRVSRMFNPVQGRECDILFISTHDDEAIREDLSAVAGTEVLTVSDAPDFLKRGGMIQFVMEGDHVRFEVNLDAVNRTHLVLSSELLRVAAAVEGKPPGGLR